MSHACVYVLCTSILVQVFGVSAKGLTYTSHFSLIVKQAYVNQA